MTKTNYNHGLLLHISARDDATINFKDYENIKLTRDVTIKYKCNCGSNHKKRFRSCNLYGLFCKKCSEHKRKTKNNDTIYDYELLLKITKRDNATIKTKDYQNIVLTRNKRIYFNCSCGITNDKIFRDCYRYCMLCEKCTNVNKQKKTAKTNLKRHGHKNFLQSEEGKMKTAITNKKKFGTKHSFQSKIVRDKIIETWKKNFEKDNPSKDKKIRHRAEQTCLKRYNKRNPMQDKKCFEKWVKSSYSTKEYIMPSGEKRLVQGYEPFALDELVKIYNEDDIITDINKPVIDYYFENKNHVYHPDIYIKSINKIIEVKSTYTYTCKDNFDMNIAKQKATIKNGYDFEFWIYDKKKNKVIV